MSEQSPNSISNRISTSIHLDYGADANECSNDGFEICERGMRFSSRWQFSLGTQLAIAFSYLDARGVAHRVTTEGIIVDCEKIACKCHMSTLLFLDLPEPLRVIIRSANPQLHASVGEENKLRSIKPAGLN